MNNAQYRKDVNRAIGEMHERVRIATEKFVAYAMENAALSQEGAERVLSAYRKCKLITLDPVSGSYRVKHGALLDAETLRTAEANTRADGETVEPS